MTKLEEALRQNDLTSLQRLVTKATVNKRDRWQQPFFFQARSEQAREVFLEHKDFNLQDVVRFASAGDIDILIGLPDLEKCDLSSLLHEVVYAGKLPEAQRLLCQGISPNTVINDNTPMLHCAITSRNLSMLTLLVEHGADLEAESREGETALGVAARIGFMEGIEFLMDQGANCFHKDKQGYYPGEKYGEKSQGWLTLKVYRELRLLQKEAA